MHNYLENSFLQSDKNRIKARFLHSSLLSAAWHIKATSICQPLKYQRRRVAKHAKRKWGLKKHFIETLASTKKVFHVRINSTGCLNKFVPNGLLRKNIFIKVRWSLVRWGWVNWVSFGIFLSYPHPKLVGTTCKIKGFKDSKKELKLGNAIYKILNSLDRFMLIAVALKWSAASNFSFEIDPTALLSDLN